MTEEAALSVAETLVTMATDGAATNAQLVADQALVVAVENVSEITENRQAVEAVAEATEETAATLEQVAALCQTNTRAIAETILKLETISVALETMMEVISSTRIVSDQTKEQCEALSLETSRIAERFSKMDMDPQVNTERDVSPMAAAENAMNAEPEAPRREKPKFLRGESREPRVL